MTEAPDASQNVPVDWTAAPETSRSNSSLLFRRLSDTVGRLIRNNLLLILAGQADRVGHTIMAQLAHAEGLRPSGHNHGVEIERAQLQDGKLVGTLWFNDQRLTFTTEIAPDPTP